MAATKRITDPQFVRETVSRSMPDLKRPRLRTESEKKFAEIEHRSAEAYANMEALAKSFTDLAAELEEDEAVPDKVVDAWEDTSMVHHVEEVRVAASSSTKKTP